MQRTVTAKITGGKALERHLKTIESQLGPGASLRVGFLESATYPIEQERADLEKHVIRGRNAKERRERNLTAKNSDGQALHVAQVAFWQEYGTVKTPERPFFRTMIERKSPRWGVALGIALRKSKYNAENAMAIMGEVIRGQLRQSIQNWTTPPNAPFTVNKKGFNKPLIDTGLMIRSADYQVMRGEDASDD